MLPVATRGSVVLLLLLGLACAPEGSVETAEIAEIAETAETVEIVDCFYTTIVSESDSQPAMSLHPDCASIDAEGRLVLAPEALATVFFDEDGLASILVQPGPTSRWAFVARSGKTAWTLAYDNGADYFAEGLARTVGARGIGFIDQNLDVVIEPTWSFAFPFEDGQARVCRGCRPEPACPDCEHTALVGGTWGYIDHAGKEVVPVIYPLDQLPSRDGDE